MELNRLAIIGARGHIKAVLQELPNLPQVRVVGVADGSADDSAAATADWCQRTGHSPIVETDWRRMLDRSNPQAVVVCGPFELHAEMAVDALRRGLHVYVEKPAALNFDQLEHLREATETHPSELLMGMMRLRYQPGFWTAFELVRSGTIGEPRIANLRKSYKLGNRPAFQRSRSTYGGTICWVGSHAIDWMLWLTGLPIRSIVATQTRSDDAELGDLEMSAQCLFQLGDHCSAVASLDLYRPATAPSHGDDWLRIVGTRGVIEARAHQVKLIDEHHDGTTPLELRSGGAIFKHFVAAVEGKEAAQITTQQTLTLTEICLRTQQSADEGGRPWHAAESQCLGYL